MPTPLKHVLRLIRILIKVGVFFTLFAFALNNQQDTVVHFFFGYQWQAPQVLVVLSVFALGVGVGVLGMLPLWWRKRKSPEVKAATPSTNESSTGANAATPPAYADGI